MAGDFVGAPTLNTWNVVQGSRRHLLPRKRRDEDCVISGHPDVTVSRWRTANVIHRGRR
jgi:hypothetical protein